MNRKGRASRLKCGRWEKTGIVGRCEMSGTLVWGRPCSRKSGGSDPEKGEDDMEDRETGDLNLRLGRPARHSLHLKNVCITS